MKACGFRSGRYSVDRSNSSSSAALDEGADKVALISYAACIAGIAFGRFMHWPLLWIPSVFFGFFACPCAAMATFSIQIEKGCQGFFDVIVPGFLSFILFVVIYLTVAVFPVYWITG
jgi:hypothetical protein